MANESNKLEEAKQLLREAYNLIEMDDSDLTTRVQAFIDNAHSFTKEEVLPLLVEELSQEYSASAIKEMLNVADVSVSNNEVKVVYNNDAIDYFEIVHVAKLKHLPDKGNVGRIGGTKYYM